LVRASKRQAGHAESRLQSPASRSLAQTYLGFGGWLKEQPLLCGAIPDNNEGY